MEKLEFIDTVKTALYNKLDESYTIRPTIHMEGTPFAFNALEVCSDAEGFSIFANMDAAFDQYEFGLVQAEDIVEDCEQKVAKIKVKNARMEATLKAMLNDRDALMNALTCRVYHKDDTRTAVMTQTIEGTDLVLALYATLGCDGDEISSAAVKPEMLEAVGITEDEAFEAAKTASAAQAEIQDMYAMLKASPEFAMFDIPEPPFPKLVVKNDDVLFGAAALFCSSDIQEQIAERLGGNFIIIPSSVHEVICNPVVPELTPLATANMIRDVNETELQPKEVLSDHAYFYDMETRTFKNYVA